VKSWGAENQARSAIKQMHPKVVFAMSYMGISFLEVATTREALEVCSGGRKRKIVRRLGPFALAQIWCKS
jgi:hypothetical protein